MCLWFKLDTDSFKCMNSCSVLSTILTIDIGQMFTALL